MIDIASLSRLRCCAVFCCAHSRLLAAAAVHNAATVAVVTNALLYALFGPAIVPVDATTKSIAMELRRGSIVTALIAASLVGAKRKFARAPPAVCVASFSFVVPLFVAQIAMALWF